MYIETANSPGNDAGDEQLADVLLGDQPVDREHRRRWNHDAQCAAGPRWDARVAKDCG